MDPNSGRRRMPWLLCTLMVLVAAAVLMPGLPTKATRTSAAVLAAPAGSSDNLDVGGVAAQQSSSVNVYMIALEDNGRSGKRVGCGDSVVPVRVAINPTTRPLRAALNQLFAIQGRTYAGRYNVLYQSTLSAGQITIDRGRATIQLYGGMVLGGVCDDPRFVAQIEETALQFSSVTSVSVLLNGEPIRGMAGR